MVTTPHTLTVRQNLRHFLAAHPDRIGPGDAVVCGVSGGGDSLALAAACVHTGLQVTAVLVDHQLQEGSDRVVEHAAAICRSLGADTVPLPVAVAGAGEAAARAARYDALGRAAAGRPVLVAHTADDDAEGLLLSLARGSGTDSLAGLREVVGEHPAVAAGAAWLGRPLLRVGRADTLGSCRELGLEVWHDPHNTDPRIRRSRVRHELLPLAREILGDRVGESLARSARLLRQDADVLDAQAQDALADLVPPDCDTAGVCALPVAGISRHPAPLRRRILRRWLRGGAGPLTSVHLDAVDALIADWHGQGPVAVPDSDVSSDTSTMGDARRLVVRRHRTDTGSQLSLEREDRTQ